MERRYVEVRSYSTEEINAACKRNDPAELQVVVIGVALYHEDQKSAEKLCTRFSKSEHDELRGNAVLGFGHIARRFGTVEEVSARKIIESALKDQSEYVRGQAWAAADDITHFLGWKIEGFES